jgi:hypothetical protein
MAGEIRQSLLTVETSAAFNEDDDDASVAYSDEDIAAHLSMAFDETGMSHSG